MRGLDLQPRSTTLRRRARRARALHASASAATSKAPFDLALRCEALSNVPQIQFNDDGVWHDFAGPRKPRVALIAGPWFPYLRLMGADIRLIDLRVDRPRATKSARKGAPAAPFRCCFG